MAATPSQRRNARQALVQALYQWQLGGDNLSEIESQFYSDDKLKKADKAYFSELLHAIPASAGELDGIYGIYLDRSQSNLDPVSLAILRIATYELTHRVDLPYKVVINEAINLAKTFGPAEAHKFVNGIVDRVAAKVRQVEIQAAKSRA